MTIYNNANEEQIIQKIALDGAVTQVWCEFVYMTTRWAVIFISAFVLIGQSKHSF